MGYLKTTVAVAAFSLIFVGTFAFASDDPILGTWRGKYAESCKAVEDVTTEHFIKIGKNKTIGYEGECDIIRQTKKQGVHELQILCETEGETVRDTLNIKVINREQISINGETYDRCK
ncbi:hypothetical protein [Agrobacterium larrymoorei]|uniref:DUF3617 family protein n=1 Tax=Agrobacterium larrymoorei TaxID=160699 RepID=A0AAF0KFF6_9HYPH|nr:hypothetical protein [Agrobacterium larrymoorei]WHA43228.1 hypothetical protein CFBP5477_018440 [Agrobacterium larrymoorei]